MELFRIIEPGLFSTIQDLGRYGYQQQGIVASGAMDTFALQAGNLFVGNRRNKAAVEVTMMGPKLQALNNCTVAVCGADLSPMLDDDPIQMWQSFYMQAGQVLSFGGRKKGMRAYICVSGGICVPEVLGSSSTYIRGNMGGVEGRQLKADDILHGVETTLNFKRIGFGLSEESIPEYKTDEPIRVILGPEADRFTKAGIKTFLNSEYKITSSADRMGYRLDGPEIEHKEAADIISDAINIGTIQIPKDGKPIILLSDRQTTGGYTRIANVISIDIPLLVQRAPGQTVKFEEVTVEKAQKLMKAQIKECTKDNFYNR